MLRELLTENEFFELGGPRAMTAKEVAATLGFYLRNLLHMSLARLAKELEETALQTGLMAHGVTEALDMLANPGLTEAEVRVSASKQIISALQAQDRIEQRCRNLSLIIHQLIASNPAIDHAKFDEIWSSLNLDELAVPELSGIAERGEHGEFDMF